MYTNLLIFSGILVFGFFVISLQLFLLHKKIEYYQDGIVDVFLQKISKIPAVIEVMRPYVIDTTMAFSLITRLHSEALIHEYISVPMILEHNARINDQYGFLMRLSMAIPELQKNAYFIYIRDFVMSYERDIRKDLPQYNTLVKRWNMLLFAKNLTLIGILVPLKKKTVYDSE